MNINELVQKHKFSQEAVQHMAEAMRRGNGTQAQFNHPEFGGMGQWQNGMLMIGDAFNHALKARVDALCQDLSAIVSSQKLEPFPTMKTNRWWSSDLGEASSAGEQNSLRYAIFPDKARLAIMRHQKLEIYDTKHYRITGIAQQQSNQMQQLVFMSSTGKTLTVDDFEQVN